MKLMISPRLFAIAILGSSTTLFVKASHGMNLERTKLDTVKLPKPISDHTASLSTSDNKIYIAGGCDSPDGNIFDANFSFFFCPSVSSSFYAFDPATKEFDTTLPDLPRERYRHGAVAINNQVWLVGGRNVTDVLLETVDVYDIDTKEWSSFDLPEGYATSDLAAWGTDTLAYFAGGYTTDYMAVDTVFSINPAESTPEQLKIIDHAPLGQARGDVAGTVNLQRGYAYVSGGFTHDNDFCEPLDAVERYSLKGNEWIEVASLPTARADKVMVSYHNHTVAMGGERQVENKCEIDKPSPGELTVAVDDVEVLNDNDSTWDILTSLPEHRYRFAAVVFEDTIYTFGGQDAYDEECNCLKTTDEVVTYVDKAHEHEEGGEEASLEGAEEGVATADEDASGATTFYKGLSTVVVTLLAFVLSFF